MRLTAVTALVLLTLAASALGEVRTLAEVHTPDRGGRTAFPVIDAHAGVVAWSDYDASVDAWRLMANVGGVTQALPVAPRATPFDVDLGPDGRGGLVAVYSRCARGLRRDQPTPQVFRSRRYGCDLYSYSFASGRERAVARANSRADEYWPAVWHGRIAFVRAYRSRRDPDRTARPYLYLRTDGRTRQLRRPGSFTERVNGNTMIEQLDLRRGTVAYAWRRNDFTVTDNFIYVATVRGGSRPVARGATSGGDASEHVRTVGTPQLGAHTVQWLFQNSGEPEYFGAFARRGGGASQASAPTKAVAFTASDAIAFYIDGGPGARFDAGTQPGGTFALKADDAVEYRRMPRSWQPIRPPH